jgi:7-cyano-7-deazaguanine synthase
MQLEFNHPDFQSPKHAIVSLSGGMDSSTLLLRCLEKFETVTALSFDYGQKHKVELKRARALVDYLNRQCSENNCYGGCKINYQVIKLDGLVNLLDSALVEGGDEVPEGHYAAENMKATVVPNRNKIFASITQAVALSVANRTEENTVIALGIHAGDHDIYPDCRQEFRDADDKAFREGNWDAERVSYYTPYLEGDKFTILQDGERLCEILGIGFDEVYARTNTSYKPTPEGWSDYKSASSVERIEAFIALGRPDPVQYADETGPVDYDVAKSYVEQVLSEYEKEQRNGK